LTAGVDAATVEPEDSVEKGPGSGDTDRERAYPPEDARAERAPKPERKSDNQKATQVRADLVVQPGAVGGQRTEIGDVVIYRAEGVRLSQPAGDPTDVERNEGERPADPGSAQAPSPSLIPAGL
jgi:hypothetical protein